MSDKQVLLIEHDKIQIEDLVSTNRESLAEKFEFMEPWGEYESRGNKVAWTRCHGLPLHLWSKDCFQKIVGIVGTLIEVDEATSIWERLEYACLKVRTPIADKVEMSQTITINDKLYCVTLNDEMGEVEHDPHRGWYSGETLSESSLSLVSRVEDSIQSDDEKWCKEQEEDKLEEI